jgi:hypothetical protein
MTAKRLLLFLTLSAVIGGSAFLLLRQKPAPEPSSAARLEAEREVYAALLASLIYPDDASKIEEYTLIEEYTTIGETQDDTCTLKGSCYPFVDDDLSELQQSTLTDFLKNNTQSYPLRDYLPSTIDNSLLTVDNQKTYWWRLSFSRIGFDSSLTQALVLVGDCRGDGCFSSDGEVTYRSRGTVLLFQKVNSIWIVQNEAQSWLTEKPSP